MENESLYFGRPYSQRWNPVYEAIRSGAPVQYVSELANEAVYGGLRNALKQLAEYGVPLEILLANRHSPVTFRKLARQAEGHDYARLFEQIAASENGGTNGALLESFVGAILDRIGDRIAREVVGSERWPTFADINSFLGEVRDRIDSDIYRIADRLADNPKWRPQPKRTIGSIKIDPTKEMLSRSLLAPRRMR